MTLQATVELLDQSVTARTLFRTVIHDSENFTNYKALARLIHDSRNASKDSHFQISKSSTKVLDHAPSKPFRVQTDLIARNPIQNILS